MGALPRQILGVFLPPGQMILGRLRRRCELLGGFYPAWVPSGYDHLLLSCQELPPSLVRPDSLSYVLSSLTPVGSESSPAMPVSCLLSGLGSQGLIWSLGEDLLCVP